MSIALQVEFPARRGGAEVLTFEVWFWAEHHLLEYGYVLGDGLVTFADQERGCATLLAHFVHPTAFRAAIEDERGSMYWREVERRLKGPPVIKPTYFWGGIPTCRCAWSKKVPMVLRATPRSKAPPLMCSKGGTIPVYRLTLSLPTEKLLQEWNGHTRSIGEMWANGSSGSQSPYSKGWARGELHSKSSWINKTGAALAKKIHKETGRPVKYQFPPVSPFFL